MSLYSEKNYVCMYLSIQDQVRKLLIDRSFEVVFGGVLAGLLLMAPTYLGKTHASIFGGNQGKDAPCSDYMRAFVILKLVQKSPNASENGGTDFTTVD